MAQIVEIHVPLLPGEGVREGDYQYPWIEQVEEFLIDVEDEGDIEVYDDGEEFGDDYVFFVSGGSEKALLAAASRVATLDGVPAGTFALVTDEDADMGEGRRVDLPVR
ncbi:hypothetical protein I4J89_31415 [Actinoplanes sp. NEAU-A11]|uniref:Uncharacterized protein n=2 Tax=Actinoplanes aureus TaxID=2792083 RepID=A0A931G2A9_9ACTN|nr:hypothetical protein [Actinoplanes aureus]